MRADSLQTKTETEHSIMLLLFGDEPSLLKFRVAVPGAARRSMRVPHGIQESRSASPRPSHSPRSALATSPLHPQPSRNSRFLLRLRPRTPLLLADCVDVADPEARSLFKKGVSRLTIPPSCRYYDYHRVLVCIERRNPRCSPL